MERIRLGCLYCDRDDFDGVDEIPTDWYAVDHVQSYEESYADANERQGSPFDWQTHIGICPECEKNTCQVYQASQKEAV